MYEERQGLWTEIIENPSGFQAHVMGLLTTEIPSVVLYFGGSQDYPVVWVKGPQHALGWFLFLLKQELYRTEHAYDSDGDEVPPAEENPVVRAKGRASRKPSSA